MAISPPLSTTQPVLTDAPAERTPSPLRIARQPVQQYQRIFHVAHPVIAISTDALQVLAGWTANSAKPGSDGVLPWREWNSIFLTVLRLSRLFLEAGKRRRALSMTDFSPFSVIGDTDPCRGKRRSKFVNESDAS